MNLGQELQKSVLSLLLVGTNSPVSDKRYRQGKVAKEVQELTGKMK
jgi:hypothetical protein